MTTTPKKLPADLVPPAGQTVRQLADPRGDRPVRWRQALESAWQRKIDEVIVLSKALCGPTSAFDSPASGGVHVSSRLQARTERAYDELAAIEDAIARIEDGTYGMCAGCDQAMSDEWLADKPEVRYCPHCSLRLVSWQQPEVPEAPPSARVQQTLPERGASLRLRQRQRRLASVD